jgi:hypothetical protein
VEKYEATAEWDGTWWVVTVHDVPVNGPTVTQGHSRTDAEDMTVDMMATMLGHRDFLVTVHFKEKSDG